MKREGTWNTILLNCEMDIIHRLNVVYRKSHWDQDWKDCGGNGRGGGGKVEFRKNESGSGWQHWPARSKQCTTANLSKTIPLRTKVFGLNCFKLDIDSLKLFIITLPLSYNQSIMQAGYEFSQKVSHGWIQG